MERQVGIGVIGMGWMGRVHSAAYRRLPEHFPDLGVRPRLLVAADVSERPARPRRARRLRAHHGRLARGDRRSRRRGGQRHARRTRCTARSRPPRSQAGKHVWVEKPVGLRARRHRRRRRGGARRAGGVTGVGFCYRFAPAVQHARDLIAHGAIGEVNHYRAVFLADYANRPDARRLLALPARRRRLGRARRPDGARGRPHPPPGRPDRPPQRPHRDADPAAPAPDRRGHALQPRRVRRPRRRRERGLGRRAGRVRRRPRRIAGGQPRRGRPARPGCSVEIHGTRGRARLGASSA